MRNKPGPPVEGDDFFDRPRDLQRLIRELENGNNLLLTAPRRVGKTSLVLRLTEVCRERQWAAAYLNVEGCSDEIAFAEKIVEELQLEKVQPETLPRIRMLLQTARQVLGGVKVGAGVDVELGVTDDPDHSTLGRALESMFRRVEKEGKRDLLLVIDEMPELLLALAKHEHGDQRVAKLLHWLRQLRQTFRTRIHWVFLGSIGLDSFVDTRNLRKTINDLVPLGLDALTETEADQFLEKLGQDNRLLLPVDIRQAIIARVGWPLPHHLQVMFQALVDLTVPRVELTHVDQAVARLMRPENLGQFETWRQRLDEQFNSADAAAVKSILRHLCLHQAGRSREQLLNVLMAAKPQAAPDATQDQLAHVLLVLQRDGYLLEKDGCYAFRSFLLREYWSRREHQ